MELVWDEEGQECSVEIGPEKPEVLLGRQQECDIRVNRPSVSRRHALFTWTANGVVVTDQGSTAGSYIDGKKVTRARMEVGQVVNCGGVMVLLDTGKAKPAARGADKAADAFRDFEKPGREESTGSQGKAAPKKGLDDLDRLFDDPPPRRRGGGTSDAPAGRSRAAELEDDASPPPRRRGAAVEEDAPPARSRAAELEDDASPPPRRRGGDAEAAKPAAKKGGFDVNAFFGSDDSDGFEEPPPEPAPRKREPEPAPVAAPAPAPPAKAHLACYLLYVDDDGAEAEVRVERDREPILVGRREGAAIKVHNPSVSGKHCTIGWQEEEIVVRDVGSSNGTFINGERIRRGVLNDGDVLRCGRFEIRVSFIEHKDIAQAEYEEWGDDWSDDELDPGQPNFHIIFRDTRNQISTVTLGEKEKNIAVGSRGCEINVENRDVEPEHCEFEWDEGVLIVKDLKSDSGTFVNDEQVETDESVRNGDVVVVGTLRLRIVRGTSDEMTPPPAEKRSKKAELWARNLENRDDDLELLFIDGAMDDDGGRHELSIWGNGEARLETVTDDDRKTTTGAIDRDVRRIVFDTLMKAGFPDAKTDQKRGGEVPAEIHMFQDRDEAKVVLSKKLTQRSPAFHEALEILRAIALEMAAGR